MKVVDASALVFALIEGHGLGPAARETLTNQRLAAPHVLDLEVVAALRRLHQRGLLPQPVALRAIAELAGMNVRRHRHGALLPRCWELRDNVKTYHAAYVALAEALGVPLVTADVRLANAPGIRCEVELLT